MAPDWAATLIICVAGGVGLLFAALSAWQVSRVRLDQEMRTNLVNEDGLDSSAKTRKVIEISEAIAEGANSFLIAEYRYLAVFMVIFATVIVVLLGIGGSWVDGAFSAVAFLLGGCTSILSGYIGMKIAVFANSRTALEARASIGRAFVMAFKSGLVMGFALVSLALLILLLAIGLFRIYYKDVDGERGVAHLYEVIAGYGLGGSSIALFGRVGGGIYTKAADVGADLVGKVEKSIPEDDPRNPAVIADNVGDNVGDIAGMGADLFGSFAEATCAALVIAGNSGGRLATSWGATLFPLLISAGGIFTCLITSFFATHIKVVATKNEIEPSLKRQLLISTVINTPLIFLLAWAFLPTGDIALPENKTSTYWKIALCVISGLWAGLVIGYVTEYYTSHAYSPVRDVASSTETGAATNIIYGLALGYKSTIIPVLALAVAIWAAFTLAHMYGIACAALGMLSTLCIGLTIDAYGPISDNAGGIAEMADLGDDVRDRTDALDAAGNTTAAIGKGFAIGSAALVSLALFGAFVTRSKVGTVDILKPFSFAGLLVGAMLPYWFSAMTMKSVGKAALAMVVEVRRQFATYPGIMEGTRKPDYKQCVRISTESSLREMLAPGALVIFTPIVVGFLFGLEALSGVLAGALVSGVQMAISMSNTGGAWDNAKKYVELGNHGGKGSDPHKAAVIGDTVGDPMKDTSGPSLNILIKLMAIISLVLAPFFQELPDGIFAKIG